VVDGIALIVVGVGGLVFRHILLNRASRPPMRGDFLGVTIAGRRIRRGALQIWTVMLFFIASGITLLVTGKTPLNLISGG
jgi:hypothetical protein